MVVDGDTGLLCGPGDVDGLAEAMVRLAGDENLRCSMAEASVQRAQKLFSVERHVNRMEQVIRETMSSERS